jgi:hypothetical protein
VSENREWRIFEPKREEERCIMRNFIIVLLATYYYDDQIKQVELDRQVACMGKKRVQ